MSNAFLCPSPVPRSALATPSGQRWAQRRGKQLRFSILLGVWSFNTTAMIANVQFCQSSNRVSAAGRPATAEGKRRNQVERLGEPWEICRKKRPRRWLSASFFIHMPDTRRSNTLESIKREERGSPTKGDCSGWSAGDSISATINADFVSRRGCLLSVHWLMIIYVFGFSTNFERHTLFPFWRRAKQSNTNSSGRKENYVNIFRCSENHSALS